MESCYLELFSSLSRPPPTNQPTSKLHAGVTCKPKEPKSLSHVLNALSQVKECMKVRPSSIVFTGCFCTFRATFTHEHEKGDVFRSAVSRRPIRLVSRLTVVKSAWHFSLKTKQREKTKSKTRNQHFLTHAVKKRKRRHAHISGAPQRHRTTRRREDICVPLRSCCCRLRRSIFMAVRVKSK